MMNANYWSGWITLVLLVAFLGGVAVLWATRREEFDEAARLPLDDGEAGNREDCP